MTQKTTGLDVRYHVLTDDGVDLRKLRLSDERFTSIAEQHPDIRKKRRWFTSLCHDPETGLIYCGQTHRDGNVLHAFDPSTGQFTDLGYDRHSEPNEMKVHRGLWLDPEERALYFGLATLSQVPELVKSPGGRLIRYDLASRTCKTVGIPVVSNYIQATNYDAKRKLLYAFVEPTQAFAVWSLKEARLVRAHFMESIVHISAIDDAGGVWGTWSHRHFFFRYDPDANEFEFRDDCVLPTAQEAAGKMYVGAGPIDCMINGGDGFMYVASALGELYRLDPRNFELRYLGRPVPHNRLPGLTVAPDGWIYGVGGNDDNVSIWRYCRKANRFEVLGAVRASDGQACFRPHDLVIVGDTLYVAETDTPQRSGYLWSCRLV